MNAAIFKYIKELYVYVKSRLRGEPKYISIVILNAKYRFIRSEDGCYSYKETINNAFDNTKDIEEAEFAHEAQINMITDMFSNHLDPIGFYIEDILQTHLPTTENYAIHKICLSTDVLIKINTFNKRLLYDFETN